MTEEDNQSEERHTTYKLFLERDSEVVEVSLIACPHDKEDYFDADLRYIETKLAQMTTEQTLFIEQGHNEAADSEVTRLKQIALQNPEILRDFKKQAKTGLSTLSRNNGTYARVGRTIEKKGIKVVNMDLVQRLDQSALDFIIQRSSLEFAIEWVYYQQMDICYDKQKIMPLIIHEIFPELLKEEVSLACDKLWETYGDQWKKLSRDSETRLYNVALRERFMRDILEKQAQTGDYVVCHPNHARQIKMLPKQVNFPVKPEDLFQLPTRSS